MNTAALDNAKERIITVLGVILTLFLLYTVYFGEFTIAIQRGFPLLLTTLFIFLRYPIFKKHPDSKFGFYLNLILIVAVVLTMSYLIIFRGDVIRRIGFETPLDTFIGLVGIIMVLEAARRTTGNAIPIIAIVFIAYSIYGGVLPGLFGHRGFSWTTLVRYVFYGGDGIMGVALGVMSSYVYVILIFGALLQVSGAGKFFLDLALALTGRMRSGPAQAAVIGSSLFGTVSGSAAANVVGTGTITIPLMKKYGYAPPFAAAVEAVASSGGQIMPPVMGAAAFLMAEYLSVPYIVIIKTALIPAVLYYLALFLAVHFEACRLDLKPVPKEERVKIGSALKKDWYFLVPIALFIYIMVAGYSVGRAAFYAVMVLAILTFFIRKETRFKPRIALETSKEAVNSSLTVWSAMSAIGIIIGVVTMSGFGSKFAEIVVQSAGTNLLLALILTMIASLIMGMGLPTIACYILLVIIVGPALAKLGVPLIAAHMFVFYYGIISAITPPVALAA